MNTPLYIPVLEERKKFTDYRYDVWGDSFNWSWVRKWEEIRYLCIHHSATNPTPNPKGDVDYIAELHRRRGWAGCGYHFIISTDGMVWYVGDISTQRANVADKNHLVIGVCLVGDFTQGNPTDEQILSSHDLAHYLINDVPSLVNVKNKGWDAVVGHKTLQATQCPGTYWKEGEDSIYNRIVGRIPYTPQAVPQPEINWRKKFDDLQSIYNETKEDWDTEKASMIEEKEALGAKVAEWEQYCQREKVRYEQIIDNLKSDNPRIPKVGEYPFKDRFSSVLKDIAKMLTFQKRGG